MIEEFRTSEQAEVMKLVTVNYQGTGKRRGKE